MTFRIVFMPILSYSIPVLTGSKTTDLSFGITREMYFNRFVSLL